MAFHPLTEVRGLPGLRINLESVVQFYGTVIKKGGNHLFGLMISILLFLLMSPSLNDIVNLESLIRYLQTTFRKRLPLEFINAIFIFQETGNKVLFGTVDAEIHTGGKNLS